MIPLFRPSITEAEVEAVARVLRSRWLGTGPQVGHFEEEFAAWLGVEPVQCIATSSCTAALDIACAMSRPTAVTALTFISDAEAMCRYGLHQRGPMPIALDVDARTLCADAGYCSLHVHYAGYPCDARKADIEDCAHALGAEWNGRKCGTMARFGCFSFGAAKNMTTGDGGMLVCRDLCDVEAARAMAWHGIDRSTWDRIGQQRYSWQYHIICKGLKGRMNDIAAAIGRGQLRRLPEMQAARERLASRYLAELRGVELPALAPEGSRHAWHLFVVRHGERDLLASFLDARGIQTGVHYRPWTEYPLYARETPPVVDAQWKRLLSLPLYPEMTEAEQDVVIRAVNEFATAGG